MLFNLLLVNITILLCFFFLSRVVLKYFVTVPVIFENAKLRLALTIPTGAPITIANDGIETIPAVAEETINHL